MPGQCAVTSSLLIFLDMEQTEGNPSEDGTTVSPTAGNLVTPGSQGTAEEVAEGTVGTNGKEEPPDGAEHSCKAASEGGISGGCPVEASILDELKTDSQGEARGKEEAKADLAEEKGRKEDTAVSSQEDTGKKEETKPEPSEVTEKEEVVLPLEKQKVDEKETNLESKEKSDVNDKAEPESKEDAGTEVTVKEAETESRKKADVKVQAEPLLQEVDGKETGSDTKELVVSRTYRKVSSLLPLWNRSPPDSLVCLWVCCLLLILLQNTQGNQVKAEKFYFGTWFQRFQS